MPKRKKNSQQRESKKSKNPESVQVLPEPEPAAVPAAAQTSWLTSPLQKAWNVLHELKIKDQIRIDQCNMLPHEKICAESENLIAKADAQSPLIHGPLNKTRSTILFENIIKRILNGEKPRYRLVDNDLTMLLGKDRFSLNQIFINAYMQHVEFDGQAQQKYCDYLNKINELVDFENSPIAPYYSDYMQNLPMAFKSVLYRYTGDAYLNINHLLRKNFSWFLENNIVKHAELTLALVDVGMLMAALNHPEERAEKPVYTYRDEQYNPENLMRKRQLCAENEIVDFTANTISSTTDASSRDQRHVTFVNPRGKQVACLSQYPEESEFMMPPTQLRWFALKGDSQHFLAQVVETPEGIPEQGVTKEAETIAQTLTENRSKLLSTHAMQNPIHGLKHALEYCYIHYYSRPFATIYQEESFGEVIHNKVARPKYSFAHALRSAYLVPFVIKTLNISRTISIQEIQKIQLAILFSEAGMMNEYSQTDERLNKSYAIKSAVAFEKYAKECMPNLFSQIEIAYYKNLIMNKMMVSQNTDDDTLEIINTCKRLDAMRFDNTNLFPIDQKLIGYAQLLLLETGDTLLTMNPVKTEYDEDLFAQANGLNKAPKAGHSDFCLAQLDSVAVPDLEKAPASEHPLVGAVGWLGRKCGFT